MIRVFLVEDEIVIREGIHRMVPWAEYGYELVGEAGDGEMALPQIRKLKPDVLITDIKMPFMDGLSLSKLVKKELPETKIVIISGYDDFAYAQQAISLGVERYLLKPISRNNFIEVLNDIRAKYEAEYAQKVYYEKFNNELQEYEQYSRRNFFEKLISGHYSIHSIYEEAEKLQIDIMAQCHNIILFSMNSYNNNPDIDSSYTQKTADLQKHLDSLFLRRTDCILFRNQVFSYAVLVKGEKNKIVQQTQECVKELKELFNEGGNEIDSFLCTGKVVERLSSLPESYQDAMNAFAYRYINRFRTHKGYEFHEGNESNQDEIHIRSIDASAINPEVIYNFLCNALTDEVDNFVHHYFIMIGEKALESRMFQQYILLNTHFSTVSFIQKLGFHKEELDQYLQIICSDKSDSIPKAKEIVRKLLTKGIQLREERSRSRYKSVIEIAVEYINKNYMDEMLSLNKVACAANVSSNHFSALFSQEMKKTFIEYLTELRMKKAKELLRCTDKRSGEIAMEIGYKDSHYFSFLFRKTQGCTPSEYRNRKGAPECSREKLENVK